MRTLLLSLALLTAFGGLASAKEDIPARVKEIREIAQTGNLKAAEAAAVKHLAEAEKALGENDPALLDLLSEAIYVARLRGDWLVGVARSERALKLAQTAHGAESTPFALAKADMAELGLALNRPTTAIRSFTEALAVLVKNLGRDHADVLRVRVSLALSYKRAGDLPKAIEEYREALAGMKRTKAPATKQATVMGNLGVALRKIGKLKEAGPLLESALKLCESNDASPLQIAEACNNLGTFSISAGKFDRAEALFKRVLEAYAKHPEIEPGRVAMTKANLAAVHLRRGDSARALKEWKAATDELAAKDPKNGALVPLLRNLAALQAQAGDEKAAAKTRARLKQLRQR